jgi:membrane fusion protein, adhesin transport system
MLGISQNTIKEKIDQKRFISFQKVIDTGRKNTLRNLLISSLIILIVLLVIPWTQNISGHGRLTALEPEKRPQSIQSIIPGRIEKWYVSEGDYVKAGDTIMRITEIVDDYFDPNLLENAERVIQNKESSVSGYMEKIAALDRQIDAMNESRKIKMSQQEIKISQSILKLQSDSVESNAARANLKVAEEQFERFKELFQKGLKSETELEQREVALQNARYKETETQNKLMISRQELANIRNEYNSIFQDYRDKISKSESEKFTALSALFDTESEISKLQSNLSGFNQRTGYYFITSPIDGYITRVLKTGVGENIKEGTEIVTLMPGDYSLAVELFIKPMDYPLVQKGQQIRFIFDGWPAFVFSGWPGASFGTYAGVIVAIDNFTNENGEYRLLVAPDPNDAPWPQGIRVGGGAKGIAMLNDVTVGYELWRRFNGFPPDFYKNNNTKNESSK